MSNRFKPGVFTRAAMAGVLAAGLVPCAASAASGAAPSGSDEGGSGLSALIDQIAQSQSETIDEVMTSGDLGALYVTDGLGDDLDASLSSAGLPEKLDLRDPNGDGDRSDSVVTPVKLQNPWGTCWAFGAIAAAETSILSELGKTYDETGLDLSELQLAWFVVTPLPEDSDNPQAGEGRSSLLEGNNRLNAGGAVFLASTTFGSGIGPVSESLVPYRNKEGKAATNRDLWTPEEIEILEQQDPDFDPDEKLYWSEDGDWSVDEQYRFDSAYELEDSNRLPSPVTWRYDGDGKRLYQYDEAGTAAIKSELAKGRAVDIGFTLDPVFPSNAEDATYLNPFTWAHYTYEKATANHDVTIVGWDDTYSKENFLEGHQPEHDGAWIVKNSWGSSSEEFPNNYGGWGIDGEGYFYLSYYDQSIEMPETLDFDVDSPSADQHRRIIDSHSFLPVTSIGSELSDGETRMANIFTASEDQTVNAIATQTGSANTSVDACVYLLDDDAAGPTDGKLVARATQSFEYAGFHKIDLASGVTVKEGQRYSVVVAQRSSSGRFQTITNWALSKEGVEYHNATNVSQWYSYATGVVNRGESMLYSGGEWADWADVIEGVKLKVGQELAEKYGSADGYDLSSLAAYDNFPIKAYADPYATPTFSDVSESDWFAGAVAKVADAGLMIGYSDSDEFGVGHALTRAELATILWRDANPADAEAYDGVAANATGMDDVADDAFYTAAVNWAAANGVADGVEVEGGAREFQPDRALTFEETVAMIAKYAKSIRGADVDAVDKFSESEADELGEFADANEVSTWARADMTWAAKEGLVSGEQTDDGLVLRPAADLLRERAAGVLSNALDLKIVG